MRREMCPVDPRNFVVTQSKKMNSRDSKQFGQVILGLDSKSLLPCSTTITLRWFQQFHSTFPNSAEQILLAGKPGIERQGPFRCPTEFQSRLSLESRFESPRQKAWNWEPVRGGQVSSRTDFFPAPRKWEANNPHLPEVLFPESLANLAAQLSTSPRDAGK